MENENKVKVTAGKYLIEKGYVKVGKTFNVFEVQEMLQEYANNQTAEKDREIEADSKIMDSQHAEICGLNIQVGYLKSQLSEMAKALEEAKQEADHYKTYWYENEKEIAELKAKLNNNH